jgi:hypothetical protein
VNIEDLRATYLSRFTPLASARLARAIDAASRRDHGATTNTIREIHTLTGEAGLLGLSEVIPVAREAHARAKVFHASAVDADAEALVSALTTLRTRIEQLTT